MFEIVEVDVEVADKYATLFELVVTSAALAVGVLFAAAVFLVLVVALFFLLASRAASLLHTHVQLPPIVLCLYAVDA